MDYTKQIQSELKRCTEISNDTFKLKIPIPTYQMKPWISMAGQAYTYDDAPPHIDLSAPILQLNGTRFIETVIPHEVAHIVEYVLTDNMTHGKLFKYILGSLFDCDYIQACHELKLPERK